MDPVHGNRKRDKTHPFSTLELYYECGRQFGWSSPQDKPKHSMVTSTLPDHLVNTGKYKAMSGLVFVFNPETLRKSLPRWMPTGRSCTELKEAMFAKETERKRMRDEQDELDTTAATMTTIWTTMHPAGAGSSNGAAAGPSNGAVAGSSNGAAAGPFKKAKTSNGAAAQGGMTKGGNPKKDNK